MITHAQFAVGVVVDRFQAEADETFQHLLMGKHRGFTGRPYRRGKSRCSWCGAPLDATSIPVEMPTEIYDPTR